jgi:putative thiazole-containing bacteriocin maturation protein
MDFQTEIRPKLKQDSIFLKTRDGVFLQSDTATFLLKGKTMYQWLATLSPHMTGEYTLGEICETLAPSQQEMVVKLIDTLLQRGVVKNHIQEAPDLLSEAVRKHFGAQIELIDHYVDRPAQRFKTFRETRILLRGAGEALAALASSLVKNGLQHLYLLPDDEPSSYLSELRAETDALGQEGIETGISCPASEKVSEYDLVVYCADDSSLKDIAELQQDCFHEQKTFLPTAFFGKQALIGPLVRPGDGPCWVCAQMRISANTSREESAAIWRELALGHELSAWNTPLFTPQARNLGNGVGFELFKYLTGCLPSETVNGLIFHDLITLESYQSKVIAHPLCPACSNANTENALQQLTAVIEGQRDVKVELGDELLRQFNVLIDERAGIFHKFTDDTITQLPLKASRLLVREPASPLSAGFEVATYNANTLLEARLTAMTEAVGRYTNSLPDRRTMLMASWNELKQSGKQAVAPAQLATWSGMALFEKEARLEWFPTRSLLTRELCYVPAAAVYPFSRLNQVGLFEKTVAGMTTHTNFEDLLTAGFTSALAYENIRQLARGHNAVARLDQETLEGVDSDLTFLLHNARHFQRPFELLEVLNPSPLHLTLAYTTDLEKQPIVVFGWGLSGKEAVSQALLHLVGHLQFLKYEGTLPTSTASMLLPEFSVRSDVTFAETISSRFQEAATTLPALQDYLRASGRDLLFAHTTTTDIWSEKLFLSGVVLLTHPVP